MGFDTLTTAIEQSRIVGPHGRDGLRPSESARRLARVFGVGLAGGPGRLSVYPARSLHHRTHVSASFARLLSASRPVNVPVPSRI